MSLCTENKSVLLIECFYGGSHKQLADLLHAEIPDCDLVTLPAKKWHWRARTGALCIADKIPMNHNYRFLFTSSVLNLAELVALRPDLSNLRKIVYFHENQLAYPVRKEQERDFQYGYNQILSCLTADQVIFNSEYNKTSFLESINSFLKKIPDHRPKSVAGKIEPKCKVLFFPVVFPEQAKLIKKQCGQKSAAGQTFGFHENRLDEQSCSENACEPVSNNEPDNQSNEVSRKRQKGSRQLHIVWPHRWEHDKDPHTFFKVLFQLSEDGEDFTLSVLGETFTEVPEIFEEARTKLKQHILHWGYLEQKEDYYKVLEMADVVVSTAKHEFFGVAMVEAVSLGCYPLCPNALVYPEIFPRICLYNTDNQLWKNLRNWCRNPNLVNRNPGINWNQYSWAQLQSQYKELFK